MSPRLASLRINSWQAATLTKARAVDDPALDSRLSAIRRQSGLDTKSSLYVLTPVAADDLDDFVQRYVFIHRHQPHNAPHNC